MARLPAHVVAHVLPTGEESTPLANVRYRDAKGVRPRIARARAATATYLEKR
jgi:NTE family protein